MDKDEKTITIALEEYKELLMIKGRYEELKERQGMLAAPIYRDSNNSQKDYDLNRVII